MDNFHNEWWQNSSVKLAPDCFQPLKFPVTPKPRTSSALQRKCLWGFTGLDQTLRSNGRTGNLQGAGIWLTPNYLSVARERGTHQHSQRQFVSRVFCAFQFGERYRMQGSRESNQHYVHLCSREIQYRTQRWNSFFPWALNILKPSADQISHAH